MHTPTPQAPARAPLPGNVPSVRRPQPANKPPMPAPIRAELTPYEERLVAAFAGIVARYDPQQIAAIKRIYTAAQHGLDTGAGARCARLLLGLYNGRRFPFDLTDLRCLDTPLYVAAMTVIQMDARNTVTEVHELLNAIYADGRNVGAELESWAYDLRLPKRCTRENLTRKFGPRWLASQAAQA